MKTSKKKLVTKNIKGQVVPEKERLLTLSIGEELRKGLQVAADREDRTLSSMARLVIKQYLDSKGIKY